MVGAGAGVGREVVAGTALLGGWYAVVGDKEVGEAWDRDAPGLTITAADNSHGH